MVFFKKDQFYNFSVGFLKENICKLNFKISFFNRKTTKNDGNNYYKSENNIKYVEILEIRSETIYLFIYLYYKPFIIGYFSNSIHSQWASYPTSEALPLSTLSTDKLFSINILIYRLLNVVHFRTSNFVKFLIQKY